MTSAIRYHFDSSPYAKHLPKSLYTKLDRSWLDGQIHQVFESSLVTTIQLTVKKFGPDREVVVLEKAWLNIGSRYPNYTESWFFMNKCWIDKINPLEEGEEPEPIVFKHTQTNSAITEILSDLSKETVEKK